MRKKFSKIISGSIKPWQIALVGWSSFAGLLLLWVPLMFYFDITKALEDKQDLFGDQFLVLNKRVSVFGAFGLGSPGFSEEDIAGIKAESGVTDVGSFTANSFRAMAVADFGNAGPVMKTEMFFESVPDRFMDLTPRGWRWHPEDEDVPIIIPSDYLALYNFGFAPGQDLPQISQDLAKLSSFQIEISNGAKSRVIEGRIAGFSDRINTILAPESFILYANKEYGDGLRRVPSRIVVKTSDSATLEKLMVSKGYETNKEKLIAGKEKGIAKNVLALAMGFGVFIMLLSLGSFLQFADLIVARNNSHLRSLLYLGYNHKVIANKIFLRMLSFVGLSFLLALIGGLAARSYLQKFTVGLIEEPRFMPDTSAILIFTGVLIGYLVIAYLNVRQQLSSLN
jgi:hypothetical protein